MPEFGTHHHSDLVEEPIDTVNAIFAIAEEIFYDILLDVFHSKLIAKKCMQMFDEESLNAMTYYRNSVFQIVEIVYHSNAIKFKTCFPLSSINVHRIMNIDYVYDFDLEKVLNRPIVIKNKPKRVENLFSRLLTGGVIGYK